MSENLRALLDFAIETAYLAGRLTLGYYQTGVQPDFKADDTPVTIADKKAEELIRARYASEKLARLEAINTKLEVLRYQTRLLKDFDLLDARRYQHAAKLINEIGTSLGGWIKQQRRPAQ